MHVSPLRFKLKRLAAQFPVQDANCLEDWLIDMANARGARIVQRAIQDKGTTILPAESLLTNEELIVGICQLQCLDRPQMLRLAAQLISRGVVQLSRLTYLAVQERTGSVLAELARQSLKVDSSHSGWRFLADAFQHEPPLKEPLLHWTRLAEPVMKDGRCNAEGWKLVS